MTLGATQPKVSNGVPYRRDIDGLRALAVLSVLAFHGGLPFLHGGYVGVDVFFVISGFLIGGHVYRDVKLGRFSIVEFYKKRAKRILPALLFVLLFCYVVSVFLLSAQELIGFGQFALGTVLSVSNFVAWLKSGYFSVGAEQNPLLMTWSLGVEEQFYVLFPMLMILGRRWSYKKLLLAAWFVTVLSFALNVGGLLRYPTASFFILPTRAWEIAAGVLVAFHEEGRTQEAIQFDKRWSHVLGTIGLALLCFSVSWYTDTTRLFGFAPALPVLGAVMLLMTPSGWVNRLLLSSPPMVFVGAISYSLYLWHWPLLSFAHIASDLNTVPPRAVWMLLASSFVFAWLSYRYVEQPFRSSRTPSPVLLRRYGLVCVLALVPAVVFVIGKGLPQRFPRLHEVEQSSHIQLAADPCLAVYGKVEPNLSDLCVPASDQRDGVALLGDSHAGAIGEAAREMASEAGLKFYEIAKTSCVPLLGVTRRMPTYPNHGRECARFNEYSVNLVRQDPRIKQVLLAGYWAAPFVEEQSGFRYERVGENGSISSEENRQNLQLGLAATVTSLRAAGKTVVIMKDDPQFDFDPVRRVRSYYIPLRRVLARSLEPDHEYPGPGSDVPFRKRQNAVASSIIDQVAGDSIQIYDLSRNLCHDASCSFYSDSLLLYDDSQHLSLVGARRALQGFILQRDATSEKTGF